MVPPATGELGMSVTSFFALPACAQRLEPFASRTPARANRVSNPFDDGQRVPRHGFPRPAAQNAPEPAAAAPAVAGSQRADGDAADMPVPPAAPLPAVPAAGEHVPGSHAADAVDSLIVLRRTDLGS